MLGKRPWITRSQVPLTPGASIRMQTALEGLIETGSGSPYLGDMLQRIGIRFILVRHDLDAKVADAPVSSLVSIALARSRGLKKVAQFGSEGAGPALEVFRVDGASSTDFRVRDVADTLTVGSGVEDAVTAIGAGMVGADQGLVVRGDSGWERPVDILGDGYRRRERNFGRVHDTESSVMTADEPFQGGRKVANYPGAPGSKPVVAQYIGLRGITASTSSGYARVIGPVRAENGPFAAVDNDPYSYWESAYLTYARDQWLHLALAKETPVPEVRITMPASVDQRPIVTLMASHGGQDHETCRGQPADGRRGGQARGRPRNVRPPRGGRRDPAAPDRSGVGLEHRHPRVALLAHAGRPRRPASAEHGLRLHLAAADPVVHPHTPRTRLLAVPCSRE